ncbi:hypothetical protein [Mesorhizobium sp. 1B3]|uniref:hypothetical protein n=1 Tax=Mesorhizobium sp. 1B3 TaxID=3243599 RepID=UPI003D967C26
MDTPSGPILIVDAGHGVGPHLASLLGERGFDVVAWVTGECVGLREQAASVQWLHDASIDTLDTDLLTSATAVIFNVSAVDEAALITRGGLADAIAADGAFFMQTLQAVSRVMIGRGRGQIWVLAADDSFAYYLPLPAAPIIHHTRIGAVRAIAKELARFGVSANAAVLQPAPETTQAGDWQQARTGVGSYAQKFKPVPLALAADTLAFWISRETLPMNGSVVHFGNGIYDGNV